MIYLNNAATSYPKPACVLDAHARALLMLPASQFRGADTLADPFEACRKSLAMLLHVRDPERIYFSSGATEAMNTVLRGLPLNGRRIAVTEAEHNSVLRPLYNAVCEPVVLPCDESGHVRLEDAARILTDDCAALIVNHCSNVTGAIQDMSTLSALAHERNMVFVADVSQSAGCLNVDAEKWQADVLVFTGHKALLGPQGTGGFYIRSGLHLRPLIFGGTGRNSEKLLYQDDDYEYEAGTRNGPGVAALNAGVLYVLERGVESIAHKEHILTERLRTGFSSIHGITVFGTPGGGPVVSFTLSGLSPSDVAYILSGSYGIIVRSGLQCAPLLHRRLGTQKGGVVRASLSLFTTEEEIDIFIAAVKEIAGNGGTQ